MQLAERYPRIQKIFANPIWALIAAFGTYFCMYGFRKPYTVGTYTGLTFFGLDYKLALIISQTIGYVLAKWVGIKFVSEIKRHQRISAILLLIGFSELMLLFFAWAPQPWNVIFLLLNGLPLGVIFGLVLGFIEGRKDTEFLVAGLCASFIVSDGVSKSVGALLLGNGITEQWMPFVAGGVFAVPTLLFIAMLACIPVPSATDIASRSAREPMTGAERWAFFNKYAPGIMGIVLVYLFTTLLRSVRADFAVEIWTGLGYKQTPELFTQSELYVSFGVLVVIGACALIKKHFLAFNFSQLINFVGLAILLLALPGLTDASSNKFVMMVAIGLGVYLPYVAIQSITFERLIAVTRDKANVGFLVYIADSVGYTGYIVLMLMRYFMPKSDSMLTLFIQICTAMGGTGIVLTVFSYIYFKNKIRKQDKESITGISAGQSLSV